MNNVDIEVRKDVNESEKLEGKEINILNYQTEYETMKIEIDNLKLELDHIKHIIEMQSNLITRHFNI